jgi:hypothetical protein
VMFRSSIIGAGFCPLVVARGGYPEGIGKGKTPALRSLR